MSEEFFFIILLCFLGLLVMLSVKIGLENIENVDVYKEQKKECRTTFIYAGKVMIPVVHCND